MNAWRQASTGQKWTIALLTLAIVLILNGMAHNITW